MPYDNRLDATIFYNLELCGFITSLLKLLLLFLRLHVLSAASSQSCISFLALSRHHICCPHSLPQTQLADVNARVHTHKNQADRHQHRPQPNVQHVDVVVGLCRRGHRRQQERQHHRVAGPPVLLPQRLGLVDTVGAAAKDERRRQPHHKAKDVLGHEHDSRQHAQEAVGRVEVHTVRFDLVGLDDGDAANQNQEGQHLECGMGVGAADLVTGRGGRLQNQNGLDDDKDAKRLEERVRREEREQRWVPEHADPDEDDKQEGAGLCEPCSAWRELDGARYTNKCTTGVDSPV